MNTPYYTDEQITLHLGDSLDILPTLPDASVDAIVTDPPYGLTALSTATVLQAIAAWMNGDRAHVPDGKGFMGADWDRFVPPPGVWDECWRVLKPGGHLLCFAAPRTYDLMALSIRIAGFEIRDSIHWIFGSGFPKGQDIGKAIDRRRDDRGEVLQVTAWLRQARDAARWTSAQIDALFGFNGMASHWCAIAGKAAIVPTLDQWAILRDALGFDDSEVLPLVEQLNARKGEIGEAFEQRETVGVGFRVRRESDVQVAGLSAGAYAITTAASDAAKRWEGWNTALKPAHEPIIVARKSTGFNTTVANVLEHGTGALNIDGCRIPATDADYARNAAGDRGHAENRTRQADYRITAGHSSDLGRWPANLVLTHSPDCVGACAPSCLVAELDRQSGVLTSGANPTRRNSDKFRDAYGEFTGQAECVPARGADSGGASRFFPVFRYEAKAPASERPRLSDGTAHATVKPLDLMRWLVRLVTPPGGTVLDPFAGSGTTGEAAIIEGFNALLIERERPYADLIVARLSKPLQPTLFGEAA